MEVKEQYLGKISDRFPAVENWDDDVESTGLGKVLERM
jgi:hypothetical protein